MHHGIELETRVREAKEALGSSVVILGHHYQRDEVIQFADFRGDSLKLAREAADRGQAEYIVFCGVRFMAEIAAVLARPSQTVLLPDTAAGCDLAEMADLSSVKRAWGQLGEVMDVEREVTPVTYGNSTANLKAFCGRHGGGVCTSSNAHDVLSWALERRPKALFFPDRHLGGNTVKRMDVPSEETLVWDPSRHLGGHDVKALERARIVLWKGHCYVHQQFLPEHVTAWREREPDVRVIVHPECKEEVVDLADEAGSTSYIVRRVGESPPDTKWAIGTEFNLVNRLDEEYPRKSINSVSPEPSYCRTMNLIDLEKLSRVLEGLVEGEVVNSVNVPPQVANPARAALERMLDVS